LVSHREQVVEIGEWVLEFGTGETIHAENSYKYRPDVFRKMAERSQMAGFLNLDERQSWVRNLLAEEGSGARWVLHRWSSCSASNTLRLCPESSLDSAVLVVEGCECLRMERVHAMFGL
jgi:Histidine-specific methyltransferase, SAM-dependent